MNIDPAVERDIVMPIRAVVTTPLAWMIRGFVLAARHLESADHEAVVTAREACIAFLEASDRIDSPASKPTTRADLLARLGAAVQLLCDGRLLVLLEHERLGNLVLGQRQVAVRMRTDLSVLR